MHLFLCATNFHSIEKINSTCIIFVNFHLPQDACYIHMYKKIRRKKLGYLKNAINIGSTPLGNQF